MGWLYGWHSRSSLVDHLLTQKSFVGDWQLKTLKHCFRGNNLWAVQQVTRDGVIDKPFLVLYKLHRTKASDGYGNWGYKAIEETCGPIETNCPLSYLDMVPDPGSFATAWRDRVRADWAALRQRKAAGKLRQHGLEV